MATIREAEARVEDGDQAIRQREAQGRVVPPAWYVTFEQAVDDLLRTWEAEQRRAVQGALVLGQGRGW